MLCFALFRVILTVHDCVHIQYSADSCTLLSRCWTVSEHLHCANYGSLVGMRDQSIVGCITTDMNDFRMPMERSVVEWSPAMGNQKVSLSMSCLMVWIWLESSLFSFVVMLAAMTGLVTPQARPSAALEGTKTYGTFYGKEMSGNTRCPQQNGNSPSPRKGVEGGAKFPEAQYQQSR